MKSLAFVALTAVPRPFLAFLGEQFRGWRRLLRASLVILFYLAALALALSPLFLALFGGYD